MGTFWTNANKHSASRPFWETPDGWRDAFIGAGKQALDGTFAGALVPPGPPGMDWTPDEEAAMRAKHERGVGEIQRMTGSLAANLGADTSGDNFSDGGTIVNSAIGILTAGRSLARGGASTEPRGRGPYVDPTSNHERVSGYGTTSRQITDDSCANACIANIAKENGLPYTTRDLDKMVPPHINEGLTIPELATTLESIGLSSRVGVLRPASLARATENFSVIALRGGDGGHYVNVVGQQGSKLIIKNPAAGGNGGVYLVSPDYFQAPEVHVVLVPRPRF